MNYFPVKEEQKYFIIHGLGLKLLQIFAIYVNIFLIVGHGFKLNKGDTLIVLLVYLSSTLE